MLQIVWDDYRHNFLSALKGLGVFENWWWNYVYLLMLPVIVEHIVLKEVIVYYCTMLPLLGGTFLARLYPNRMSKTLFLCPMSREMRIRYFKTAFLLRIAIPILAFLLPMSMLFLCKIVQGFECFLSLLAFIMYLVAVNICTNARGGKPKTEWQGYSLPGYFPMWNVLGQISGIANVVIVSVSGIGENSGEPYRPWELIMVSVLLVIQVLILMKIIFTYFKPIMEQSISYEYSYISLEK